MTGKVAVGFRPNPPSTVVVLSAAAESSIIEDCYFTPGVFMRGVAKELLLF